MTHCDSILKPFRIYFFKRQRTKEKSILAPILLWRLLNILLLKFIGILSTVANQIYKTHFSVQ